MFLPVVVDFVERSNGPTGKLDMVIACSLKRYIGILDGGKYMCV
jgi:hypothetical protein